MFEEIKEGQSVLFVLAVTEVTLIRHNRYADAAYLGIACFASC